MGLHPQTQTTFEELDGSSSWGSEIISEDTCVAEEVDGSSSWCSEIISEEACVAEEVDGSSSWGSEIIYEEACMAEEVDASSSWPVPEGAPKYFRSAPEFELNYSIWIWHPKYMCCTIKYTCHYAQFIKPSE